MKSKTEEVAQQNNYFFIGDVMTAVETKITDEDKIKLSEDLSDNLILADRMTSNLADYTKAEKEKIREVEGKISKISRVIKAGYFSEDEMLPCYLDRDDRVFLHPVNGTEVKRVPALPSDRQLRLKMA